VFTGSFKDEHFHGKGTYKGINGEFEGEYVDGVRQGSGVFRMANGDYYEGEFSNNVIEGSGSYTWKANGHNYKGKIICLWR
jgi:hypothetical protein